MIANTRLWKVALKHLAILFCLCLAIVAGPLLAQVAVVPDGNSEESPGSSPLLQLGPGHSSRIGQIGRSHMVDPSQQILERLEAIESKLDALAGPQITATFCISQGRSFALGADWFVQVDTEWEGGLGWAEVFSGEGTAEVKIPAGVLPVETALRAEGAHGRGFDICVDLPVEVGPTDTALLQELALDINQKAEDFPNRGKFQRRAHRVLNYTKRRVPGLQVRTDADVQPMSGVAATDEDQGQEDELDVVDEAVDNILNGGVSGIAADPLGVWKSGDILALVSSLEGVPADIRRVVDDPEQLFDPLSDIGERGVTNLGCADIGISDDLRSSKPGMDQICQRLEGLPDYKMVEQVLSGSLIADLYDALDSLTIKGGADNVSSNARSRFCQTAIGQRGRYDGFCGRA